MKISFIHRSAALLLCAIIGLSMAGCKEVEEDTDFSTPKLPDTALTATAGGNVNLPGSFVMPTEAGRMATGFTGSEMFGGFTLISSSKTDFFTTSGTITLNLNATLLRLKNEEYQPATIDKEYQNISFALFRKDGDDIVYVSTALIPANGENQTATFSGLDSGLEYRFVITYTDYPRTRTTGTFSAAGITSPASATSEDNSDSLPAE